MLCQARAIAFEKPSCFEKGTTSVVPLNSQETPASSPQRDGLDALKTSLSG